ncbi:acyl-coenzyme A thioesterase PaaI-like protein [Psychromicrobium silvestre]|uniref:Acyl-coenzyme A thioesterase PaaI-like protein n=1 Tax=Psychromicrobium silvestre TaxID=1645614 RepID=A0A7Y9S3E8_9MICC|nr:DUF4442 domain-containing protein [Psychromicrobium silvestre]NYE93813.1 acyl-coenzyme A thioesterase PaaI-like protein [Psychromicrobium silvestre]
MKLLGTKASTVRHALNLWPPFLGAGIRVEEISADFRYARVSMKSLPWNRNVVGTHFGGSLFAMTDPFWMLLIIRHLASDHVVWDKAAEIDFRRPGRGKVRAEFRLSQEQLVELRAKAADGGKVLEWFSADVIDQQGEIVATMRKQIYLRRKRA